MAAFARFPPSSVLPFVDGLMDGFRLEGLNPTLKSDRPTEALLRALAQLFSTVHKLTDAVCNGGEGSRPVSGWIERASRRDAEQVHQL